MDPVNPHPIDIQPVPPSDPVSAAVPAEPIRLGIFMTHPVQYFSPWFAHLAARPEFDLKVFYAGRPDPQKQGTGFGVNFTWDIPLLEGYPHEFLNNVSRAPGSGFFGFDAPEIADVVAHSDRRVWLVPGWGFKCYWQAIRACARAGRPMITRGDSNLLARRRLAVRAAKWIALRRLVPTFSACLAVGKLAREYYLHYGAKPDRIFLSPHFVDNDRLSRGAAAARLRRSELRRKWGVGGDKVTFIFCGKFQGEIKRPTDPVLALGLLSPELRGRAHLLMVGEGEMRGELERTARAAELPVSFTGFLNQSEIADAYAASDVLVLSSASETWGLVVNEAMASGLPAIVTDQVGCGPDLIIPGETGDVYPSGEVGALAARMSAYVREPALARARGENARRLVFESYSMEAATRGLIEACRAVGTGAP